MTPLGERLTVIILTCNRREELRRTLEQMRSLPEPLPLIAVDNASQDGTAAMVRSAFPEVALISLPRNIGAAARNAGARRARTEYIAFCDDDTWWAPGARAASCSQAAGYVSGGRDFKCARAGRRRGARRPGMRSDGLQSLAERRCAGFRGVRLSGRGRRDAPCSIH